MFKALDKNRNSKIRLEDYNEDIHKSNLCCPDPNYTATVHFATDRDEKHLPACDVLIMKSPPLIDIEQGAP